MNGGGDTDAADAFFENVDVRIPRAVVDEGVRAIKKALREVVDIEDDSDTEGGGDAQQQQEQHEAAMATTAMEDGGGRERCGEDRGGRRRLCDGVEEWSRYGCREEGC